MERSVVSRGEGVDNMRVAVAQLGPGPDGPGGMPAVIAALLSSPLAVRYEMEAIPTYRDSRPLQRLLIFVAALLRLARWSARPGPRIAHVHMAARGSMYRKLAVVAVAKAMRRPVVLHVHAGPGDLDAFVARLDRLRLALLRLVFTTSDRVLAVSLSSAEALARTPLAVGIDITVVPNAPPPVVEGAAPRPAGEGVEILFLGGFANQIKGGEVLVKALSALLAQRPEARVSLAGPGEPPAQLPDGARWLGWLDRAERDAALAGADLFVMPSLSEGMPIALLEAMAAGLPIVATRVGGIPEVLSDGIDATLVPASDPAALAAALAALVDEPKERARLGAAAAARARRLADEDVYQRLDRIYLEVIR
jgi:glycosyltransferase involved in cell wall biosynthesis